MELDPEQAKKEASANELISQCEASRGVWLQHINFTIDAFIDNQSTQRNLMESKEKIADLLKKSNEVFEKTAAEKGDAP
jgi:truncated hemoglobin YjbI